MTLQEVIENFNKATKLVLKEKLSKNIETLSKQRTLIIEKYNEVVNYVSNKYYTAKRTDQVTYDITLEKIRTKLIACLNKLECTHNLPHLTEIITDEHILWLKYIYVIFKCILSFTWCNRFPFGVRRDCGFNNLRSNRYRFRFFINILL